MEKPTFTDYNILAREDGSTSFILVGMERVFQRLNKSKVFEEPFDSLDHVVNAIMETIDKQRVPKIHSTLLGYTRIKEASANTGSRKAEKKKVLQEVVDHLPNRLRSYIDDRLPGSNVTTIEEDGKLIGYRTINHELPYLVSVLNLALVARKEGRSFDAVQHKSVQEAEPPISY